MPPVVTIEPEENNRLVYLRVAAKQKGSPQPDMLAFRLRIDNKAQGAVEEHLQEIEVTLKRAVFEPNNNPDPKVKSFPRTLTIPAGGATVEYLSPTESIELPAWPDFQASIRAKFASGWVNVSGLLTSVIAPHQSPTPEKSYQFPFSGADLGQHEYLRTKSRHTGGDQHFGYDIGAIGWDAEKKEHVSAPGSNGEKNSDYVVMGKPVHAMADGEVLEVDNDVRGNPVPKKRLLQQLGQAADQGPFTYASVARLTDKRLVTLARDLEGKLVIRIWDELASNKLLVLRGAFHGEALTRGALTGVSSSRFVAVLEGPTAWKVVVFDVSANGMTVTEKAKSAPENGGGAAITAITKSRVAVVSAPSLGKVHVSTWDVSDDGTNLKRDSTSASIEGFPKLAICAVTADANDSSGRLVTAARTADNKMLLTTWIVDTNGAVLFRTQKDGGAGIDAALSSWRSTHELASAVRDGAGVLRVAVWRTDALGNLTRISEAVSVEAPEVSIAWLSSKAIATAAITAEGTLHIVVWEYEQESISFFTEILGGAADLVAITPLQTSPLLLGAVTTRTPTGALEARVFWPAGGGGNHLVLKHGGERVLYAHMVEGSISPSISFVGAQVKKGQFLGNAGNSGSSSGPHLHIHALDAANLAYRPLPFNGAKAVRAHAPELPAPPQEPAFATVDDRGFYWEEMAIKPTW